MVTERTPALDAVVAKALGEFYGEQTQISARILKH
jgi:hypothetical protein